MNATALTQKLATDILVDLQISLFGKKAVPEMVAATNNLNVVQVVRVDSWEADTTVVHLACEDFVSEKVVSEKTAVAVSEVVGLSHSHIGEIAEKSMHAVVLLLDIVEVFSVLVDSE